MNARRLAVTVGVAAGLLASSPAIAMQDASPVPGPPLPEGCSVVAEGLMNPRFVAVADDGTIYITEAGMGGDEVISAPLGEGEPGATPVDQASAVPADTRGFTGQVTMVAPDGTLWAWGDGALGQLGDGTTTSRVSPVQVGAESDWTSVAADSSCPSGEAA